MYQIHFTKMHGLGNDFVMIDQRNLPAEINILTLVKVIADRHTAIGCDQLIIYSEDEDKLEMQIYNMDGSPAEACGNATRCLAFLAYEKTGVKEHVINVAGRKLIASIQGDNIIEVNMGAVSFNEKWIPKSLELATILEPFALQNHEFICADIGNPHLIIFGALSNSDQALLGEKLERHALFSEGVNINFARLSNNEIDLRVWERGAGFTLACGSGACASFAAAKKLRFVDNEAQINFSLGSLKMKYVGGDIYMSGKVTKVFEGTYYYE